MKKQGLMSLLAVMVVGLAVCTSAHNHNRLTLTEQRQYTGTFIGKLSTLAHGVKGAVYAVDDTTLYLENFSYDGTAPDAFFYAGSSTPTPTPTGYIIPDEDNETEPLGEYHHANITLKLPQIEGTQLTVSSIKWFSVWCRAFELDFGHVIIPDDLDIPTPQVSKGLQRASWPRVSSSSVTLHNTDTITIKDFCFDASLKDVIFVVGRGDSSRGDIQVPDENGSYLPLSEYDEETLTLTLPARRDEDGDPIRYICLWSVSRGVIAEARFDTRLRVPPALYLD